MTEARVQYDVFICHASEDKEAVARPLAEALRANGLQVWIDEFVLTVGDSLSRKINEGLGSSRYGIVILSPSFFAKRWPPWELDTLETLGIEDGRKVILPVWHEISKEEVRAERPSLAGILAAQTADGINKVVDDLLKAMQIEPKTSKQMVIEAVADARLRAADALAAKDLEIPDLSSYDFSFEGDGNADFQLSVAEGKLERAVRYLAAAAGYGLGPRQNLETALREAFVRQALPGDLIESAGLLPELRRALSYERFSENELRMMCEFAEALTLWAESYVEEHASSDADLRNAIVRYTLEHTGGRVKAFEVMNPRSAVAEDGESWATAIIESRGLDPPLVVMRKSEGEEWRGVVIATGASVRDTEMPHQLWEELSQGR